MPRLLSLRGTKCRSKPVPFSSKNGFPRFLTEPRNDRGRCQACCHCEPQGEAIQCRSRQRLDCRGSLRNLAMTEDDAKPAVIASRKAKQSSAVLVKEWIAAVPCGTSQ